MRNYLLGSVALWLVGCASDLSTQPGPTPAGPAPTQPAEPVPTVTGSYLGHYTVPAPGDLAAAATFPPDQVDWTVTAGVATLHYNLPSGLVGGTVPVLLTGPVTPGAAEIQLTGDAGGGTCTAAGTRITCREEFGDLGELPISMTVVEKAAEREYAGPVADRVAIANRFSSDPIGIVEFDLSRPVVDDKPEGPDDGAHP